MPWQDAYSYDLVIAKIRRLAAKGWRIADVAEFVGFDTTPGMVAGLARRAKPPIKFGQPAPPMPKFVIVDEGDSESVHWDDLKAGDKRCRRPLWTSSHPRPHEKRVCGAPVVGETSWCAECSKIVYEHDR